MTLSTALDIALTGLQTSTAQLQLTANNIANASTPGYTKKSANLSSTALGGTAGGISIASYMRATSTVLSQSLNVATSSSSYYSTQNSYLQQIQSLLDSSSNPPALADAAAQFSSAWTQLQASPEDPTVQQSVIQAGNTLAQEVGTAYAQMGKLQTQVENDTQNTVGELNQDLVQVANLNSQILTATSNNQPTGNLEDERDQAINDIASITNVSVFQRNQGQVALYTSNGVALLDGTAQVFSFNGTGAVTNSANINVADDLTGGSLQAQLQFAATATTPSTTPGVNTLQKLQNQLQDIVKAFTTNSSSPSSTFANAYNPTNTTGADFFTATGNNPGTFAVNSALLSGTSTIPQANVANVANTFATNFNFTDSSAGITLASGSYTDFVNTVLSGFQQAANAVSTQSQSATQQQQYYQQSLSSATGVNVDTELVNLTNLQNSYAASAHLMSTINQMYNELLGSIG